MMFKSVFLAVASFTVMALADENFQGGPVSVIIKTCCPSYPNNVINEDTLQTCRGTPGAKGKLINFSCMVECAFKIEGFIIPGSDGKDVVDLDGYNDHLKTIANGPWASVMAAAQNDCTKVLPTVKPNATCTSGAGEINFCLTKNLLRQCPDLKTEDPTCKKIFN